MEDDEEIDRLSSELPLLPAPDLIGPVFGFRDWRLDGEGLRSPRTGTVWDGRILRAACVPRTAEDLVRPPHAAPGHDCSCGVHAAYRPSDAISKVDFRGVSGIVTVWGHVEAHATGMRAEYARIEALGLYRHWTRRRQQEVTLAAAALGVDLVDLADLAEAAHRYAAPLPVTLVPPSAAGRAAGVAGARQRVIVADG